MNRPAVTPGPVSPDEGFTLIEVLTTLAVFAILLSLIPGALQLGRRAWEGVERMERAAELAGARSFVTQRVAAAMPVRETGGRSGYGIAFAGRPDSLMFVSPAPDGPGAAGIYRFEIGVTPPAGAGGHGSVIMRQALFAASGQRGETEERILWGDVSQFRLRYFGSVDNTAAASWHEAWTRADILPDLIEVSVAFTGLNAPYFEPLVIELRLRTPALSW